MTSPSESTSQHVAETPDHEEAEDVVLSGRDRFKTDNPYPHTLTFETFWRRNKPNFPNVPFPAISTFLGTIKLHGVNSTIIFSNSSYENPIFQSRSIVLALNRDNRGTVEFLHDKPLRLLVEEIVRIRTSQGHSSDFKEIMIAGEVCGRSVNKGVAISHMNRFFTVFNIRVDNAWVDMRDYAAVHLPEHRIFNIMNWQTWEMTVDFADEASVKEFEAGINQITEDIGETCPFAKTFNDHRGQPLMGKGEGLVWTLIPAVRSGSVGATMVNFKTKCHMFDTTVRLASLPPPANDPTLMQCAERFVDYALSPRRLEQGVEYLSEGTGLDENTIEKAHLRKFLDWVVADMLREEIGMMEEMGAVERDVRKVAILRARAWFLDTFCKPKEPA